MLALGAAMQALGHLWLWGWRLHTKTNNAEDDVWRAELCQIQRTLELRPFGDLLSIHLDDSVADFPAILLGLGRNLHDHDSILILIAVIEAQPQTTIWKSLVDRYGHVRFFLWQLCPSVLLSLRAQQPLHWSQAVDVCVNQTIGVIIFRILAFLCLHLQLIIRIRRFLKVFPRIAQPPWRVYNPGLVPEHLSQWILIFAVPDLPTLLDALLPLGGRTLQRQRLLGITCLLILPFLELFKKAIFDIANESGRHVEAAFVNAPHQQPQAFLHERLDTRCVDGTSGFTSAEIDEKGLTALSLNDDVLNWIHYHHVMPDEAHHCSDEFLGRLPRPRIVRPSLSNEVDTINLVESVALVVGGQGLWDERPRDDELIVWPNLDKLLHVRQPQLRDKAEASHFSMEGLRDGHLARFLQAKRALHLEHHEV
mmetsp:Transcript_159185/g.296733  ORF Transcript_159185/g.296733 Transcript_159185/m.296733 type:complete len:423 (+) Transcript_159185:155-1423(+)